MRRRDDLHECQDGHEQCCDRSPITSHDRVPGRCSQERQTLGMEYSSLPEGASDLGQRRRPGAEGPSRRKRHAESGSFRRSRTSPGRRRSLRTIGYHDAADDESIARRRSAAHAARPPRTRRLLPQRLRALRLRSLRRSARALREGAARLAAAEDARKARQSLKRGVARAAVRRHHASG